MSHPVVNDLPALAAGLIADARAASSGRASRTIFGGNGETLHQTLVALAGGRGLASHTNPGQATVLILLGSATLLGGPEPLFGTEGTLLAVPDGEHSLTTDEDTVLLLTIAHAT